MHQKAPKEPNMFVYNKRISGVDDFVWVGSWKFYANDRNN